VHCNCERTLHISVYACVCQREDRKQPDVRGEHNEFNDTIATVQASRPQPNQTCTCTQRMQRHHCSNTNKDTTKPHMHTANTTTPLQQCTHRIHSQTTHMTQRMQRHHCSNARIVYDVPTAPRRRHRRTDVGRQRTPARERCRCSGCPAIWKASAAAQQSSGGVAHTVCHIIPHAVSHIISHAVYHITCVAMCNCKCMVLKSGWMNGWVNEWGQHSLR